MDSHTITFFFLFLSHAVQKALVKLKEEYEKQGETFNLKDRNLQSAQQRRQARVHAWDESLLLSSGKVGNHQWNINYYPQKKH